MPDENGVTGADPLVDGQVVSLRLRQDLTVTDADRLLATARRLYREDNPEVSADEVAEWVTCAADAMFVILEHAGLVGDEPEGRLAGFTDDGLGLGGWRAQLVLNEPHPLLPGPRSNCVRTGDVFALPSGEAED